jgi:hypothetical protein
LLKIGEVVRFARKNLYRHPKLGKYSLVDFATACHNFESEALKKDNSKLKRKGRAFAAGSAYAGRLMSDMEDGTLEVSAAQARIMEAVLELPPYFLDASYLHEEDVETAFKLRKSHSSPPSKVPNTGAQILAGPGSPPDGPSADSVSSHVAAPATTHGGAIGDPEISFEAADSTFLIFPPGGAISSSRRRVIEEIEAFFDKSERSGGRGLILLHGEYGTGKSFVSRRWWAIHGRNRFPSSAIRIDCSNKTINDITRELTSYLFGEGREIFDESVMSFVRRRGSTFVLFDQVSLEGPDAMFQPGNFVSPVDLVHALAPLFAARIPLKVLLSVRADSQSIEQLRIEEQLPSNVLCGSTELRVLNAIESAELFSLQGVGALSEPMLGDLSRRLGGLPLCITAAAQQLKDCDSSAEREAYCVNLGSSGDPSPAIKLFFDQYLAVLTSRPHPRDTHPQAILRLLALMPGATHRQFLRDLVEELRLSRLREFEIDSSRRYAGPFVTMNRDRVDLHPMARESIRAELDAIVKGRPDPHTNSDELARIHLVAAQLSFRSLSDVPPVLSLAEIEAIEGVIFHLLRYRDVREKLTTHLRKKSAAREIHPDDVFEGAASAIDITSFCFKEIAHKFLFDGDHQVSLFLGQHETKAKILCHFFPNQRIAGEIPFFDVRQSLALLIEIAVCFMHSGRLKLASSAAVTARKVIDNNGSKLIPGKDGTYVSAFAARRMRAKWLQEVEVLTISTLIDVRMGVRLTSIVSRLTPHVLTAERLFDILNDKDARKRGLHSPNLLKALVRLFSRRGHIDLLRGEIERAIQQFKKAAYVDIRRNEYRRNSRPFLTGEVARRYAAALIRGSRQDPGRLDLAHKIIEFNIGTYEEVLAYSPNKTRNEVIPFYILSARIQRESGDLALAEATVKEVMNHEYIRSGECTLAAQVDLELERLEIKLAKDEIEPSDREGVVNLIRKLEAEHHLLMATECRLFYARASTGDERREALKVVEGKFADQGVRLWDPEIARAYRA